MAEKKDGSYRQFDSAGLNLIGAYPKVLQILKGEIPTPEVVEIFPTNFCNFSCSHCRFKEIHGTKSEYLSIDNLDKMLRALAERGVNTVELSGGGEALEHPEVEAMFDKFVEYGFRLGIITNGYRFVESPQLIDKILKNSDWVRFSVDAFTDDTYRKVHGRRNISYEALKERISQLTEKADKTKVGLKILISKLNSQDALLAIPEALQLGADFVQFKFLGSPKRLTLDDDKSRELAGQIRQQISGTESKKIITEIVPAYKGDPDPEQKCLMTFLHPVVDWDGEMYVCAFFENRKQKHSLGNVNSDGFFGIWDSQKHIDIFNSVNSSECVPNCPMLRYNPVIDFIKSDNYRFKYV